MSDEPLIRARGLSKVYPRVHLRRERMRSLRRILVGKQPSDVDVVLDSVDLDVLRGQSVGIIGENGAGKSTLLKLITRVLTPSAGSVSVNGSIGALLELGAGFHPEHTGLENIRMAASLVGLSPRQLHEKLPEIVAFADIGDYVNRPIKQYSSGMVVRLGFAIIASARPDLLITDEVLAVGDEGFQKKCIRWMEEYLDSGGTLLLVSHSMYHVQKLCKQAIWLREGKVVSSGDVFDVTQAYLAWHERRNSNVHDADPAYHGSEYRVVTLGVNHLPEGQPVELRFAEDLHLDLLLHSPDGRPPVVSVGIVRADGTPIYGLTSDMDGVSPQQLSADRFRYTLHFRAPPLLPGAYRLRCHALDPEALRLYDTVEQDFTISGNSREFGMVHLPHIWNPRD